MKRTKYLHYTDTHLNFSFPWTQRLFAQNIKDEKPHGIFLTGDIACGMSLISVLEILAIKLDPIPIYFVLGNHDIFGSSFEKMGKKLETLLEEHPNLIWMPKQEPIALNKDCALIGVDGWYDLQYKDEERYTFYNLDWIMIEDFQRLPTLEAKKELSRQLAEKDASLLKTKLLKALEEFQTVYILTHIPPYKEATHYNDFKLDRYWRPYNTNVQMGKMIEEIMAERADQNVILLAGHTHEQCILNISHNIECIVGEGKYLGDPKPEQSIFI